jgi:hypothetical protein
MKKEEDKSCLLFKLVKGFYFCVDPFFFTHLFVNAGTFFKKTIFAGFAFS